MSTEEYLFESSASSHHSETPTTSTGEEISADQASNGLEAELAQMDASSSAPEAGTGRGQEASSSGQGSSANLAAPTRGAWKGSDVNQPEIDWLYRSRRIPAEVSCRIPGNELEPAPQPGEAIVFTAHFERGFGLPASNFFHQFLDFYELQPHHLPDPPSASANPQVVEHAAPLQAEVGREFLDNLASCGRKNKAPASEAGPSEDPPAKRSKKGDASKKGTVKRYLSQMSAASGPALSLSKSASGMRPETSEDAPRASPPHQAGTVPYGADILSRGGSNTSAGARPPNLLTTAREEDLSSPPEAEDTGASNIGAGKEEAERAEPLVPPVPKKKKKKATASPSKTVPKTSLRQRKRRKLLRHTRTHQHPRRLRLPASQTSTSHLNRKVPSSPPNNLLRWSRRQLLLPPARGPLYCMPAALPLQLGTLDARKQLFEELLWEHRFLADAHSKCQAFPEASFEDLSAQLSMLKAEKEQLVSEHCKALDAQEAITAGLKDQLMEAKLRHARELKEAQAAAEAKLDESLKEHTNATAVLRTELEEETLARKGAQDRIATFTADQAEYDRLVMQADALALKHFPDSQPHALKKVAERRAEQAMSNPDAPWDAYDHLVACRPDPAHASLRVACSWYVDMDLDALHSLRGDAPTDTDPLLTAKRQDHAYQIAEFARFRTFIPPPEDVKDEVSEDEEEGSGEGEEDEEAGEGDAPPEEGDAPPEAPKLAAPCRLDTHSAPVVSVG
ncbi:hypothetical protein QYE76_050301 [Lolium multiflorum]|uniref:Transposase (putative) gypsy type domain-containing protein n=1 Tax=Lolium multiflorum TaxID=4521 RepID=A0AAD8SPP2_LOLMU|nr:hypothetical protein QYE76_050301 [Lolium multiflorum]